jgi:hypothetical protein
MLGPLKLLKTKYGIRTVITEPVEVELRHIMGNLKFRDMKHVLTKALGTSLITVLDESLLGTLIDPAESPGRLRAIEDQGEAIHNLGVGIGESYSHSAAIELGQPILTNDKRAIRELLQLRVSLRRPFLRSFDILAFGAQVGHLSHADCDSARQSLVKRGDRVQACFMRRSFSDGLRLFYPRLVDGTISCIGSPVPIEEHDDQRLVIVPA